MIVPAPVIFYSLGVVALLAILLPLTYWLIGTGKGQHAAPRSVVRDDPAPDPWQASNIALMAAEEWKRNRFSISAPASVPEPEPFPGDEPVYLPAPAEDPEPKAGAADDSLWDRHQVAEVWKLLNAEKGAS